MRYIFGIFVILVSISYRTVLCGDCCTSKAYLLNGKCSDGSNITLECVTDKYMVTSNEFLHNQDTLNFISEEGNITIFSNNFCIGYDGPSKVNVALICFEPEEYQHNEKIGFKIYSICILISDIFLVITLIVYLSFPTLRDLQGKSVMSFTFCLCLGYFILAVMQQEYFGFPYSSVTCKFMGFVLYYLLMCAFFWLSIISFNIWRSATWQVTWSDSQLLLAYNIVGYCTPIIFLIAAIVAHHTPGNHIKPDFSASCWFSGKSETWAFFYGPIAVLLTCNIVFFTLTAIRLWKDYKDTSPGTRIQVLRFKCVLYLKLFLTMGISWIFEIASYLFEPDIWFITDIVNCLQGVIIFIVMVATRKRVLRLIANSGIFGSCFYINWQTINDDEESENEVHAEQIQLS
ncbi:hypothetical protein O3M35_004000 [Rhynocoris fuscipes]|uniref:G-protein coupled receptors family 2 profile 2 domain-containing protein n=1 Tax=Rhynocoris fuscipes TaxID=488301 RepID=A0AAW1CI42_9HEMI